MAFSARRGLLAAALGQAVAVGLARAAQASPPPPPPAGYYPKVVRSSCGPVRGVAVPAQVPVKVTRIDAADIGFVDGKLGRLRWRWGMRFSSADPRLGAIVGLDDIAELGLVAATAGGDWIVFDDRKVKLGQLASVGLASMRGAPSAPSAMLVSPTGQARQIALVNFPASGVLAHYALSNCGLAAAAVPAIRFQGPPPTAMAEIFFSYLGLAAHDADTLKTKLSLPYRGELERLDESSLPVPPGYRIKTMTNPVKIQPYPMVLWTAKEPGADSLLQQIYVGEWGDVHQPSDKPYVVELARLKRTPSAMVASGDEGGTVYAFLAFDGPEPGTVDLHYLDFDQVWPPRVEP